MRTRLTNRLLLAVSVLLTIPVGLAHGSGLDVGKLENSKVKYIKHNKMTAFPVPVFALRRGGLASGADEIEEIKEKIVYPLINESPEPIAAIVITFFSGPLLDIGVDVYWSSGKAHGSLVTKNSDGHYDPQAYRIFFLKPTP